MHAEAFHQRGEHDEGLLMPVLMALALHAALVALLILAGWWQPLPEKVSVAGPVVEAALVVSPDDVAQALEAVQQAPRPVPPEPVQEAPPPQPEPVPQPQDAPVEIQPTPQQPVPEPDQVEQEAVARLALEAAEREREEQEARHRQEQIDLTQQLRREQAEERQRRRQQQLADLRRQREEARRQTQMEQDRLQQIEDARAARNQPRPTPDENPGPQSGNNGEDADLLARYALAMHQSARANWNTSLAPEATPCKVSFTQVEGGEVTNVRFLSCGGFDAAARDSVERALRRDPMPYAGFEPVFRSEVELTFCHPDEACQR